MIICLKPLCRNWTGYNEHNCILIWTHTVQIHLYTQLVFQSYIFWTLHQSLIFDSGTQLLRALENGVSAYPKLEGRFPQVSGVSFGFNPNKPPGKRVIASSVKVHGYPVRLDHVRTNVHMYSVIYIFFKNWLTQI